MVLALQQSYDQSTGDLPVDDQQSISPVCVLCEVSHSHKGKVSIWQSTQACEVVNWYGITWIHSSGANCHLIECASYTYRYAHLRAKGGAAAWAMQESDYFRSLEAPAKRRYVEKLSTVGFSLEDDPYLPKNEVRFSDDMTTWPQIEFGNIFTYFILRPGLYTQEQLLLRKQLDSYNFLQAGYARSVFSLTFQHLGKKYVLQKVNPSQRSPDEAREAGIIALLDRMIICAHCTCMAG